MGWSLGKAITYHNELPSSDIKNAKPLEAEIETGMSPLRTKKVLVRSTQRSNEEHEKETDDIRSNILENAEGRLQKKGEDDESDFKKTIHDEEDDEDNTKFAKEKKTIHDEEDDEDSTKFAKEKKTIHDEE